MPVTPDALAHAEDLADFVAASPSSYHAAAEVARRLEDAGFERLAEEDAWDVTPGGRYVVVRDGAAIAWTIPTDAVATTPAHVFGAHTDSPGFKLKPQPTTGSKGWLQAAVEVYGGPLLNSWLDRELRLAGRLALADGRVVLADTGAMLRLPQLAVHLDREANTGLALDKQYQTQPVWGVGDPSQADILAELAESAGVSASDIRGYDVVIADTARGAVFGKDDAFFASGRLDDLASVHAGVVALETMGSPSSGPLAILAAFDHEELGSNSRSGAAGPFLEDILGRIYDALGADASQRRRALSTSWCLSSDVGHSARVRSSSSTPISATRRMPSAPPRGAAGARAPTSRRRSSCRTTRCPAARRSARSRRRASASARSTSASRSCRCTRRASSRGSRTCTISPASRGLSSPADSRDASAVPRRACAVPG
jgi:aspartyl aminopeptidase